MQISLAREKGFLIDITGLSSILHVPVIPTVAVCDEGIDQLKEQLQKALENPEKISWPDNNLTATWENVELLSDRVLRRVGYSENSKKDIWDHRLTNPWPVLPLAGGILLLIFAAIVGIGMGLRNFILLPFSVKLLLHHLQALLHK